MMHNKAAPIKHSSLSSAICRHIPDLANLAKFASMQLPVQICHPTSHSHPKA
jgi:hypothetical protein